MRSIFRSCLLSAALLLACAPAAAAQLPGGELSNPRDGRQAYLAEVLGKVEDVAQQWRAAREARDAAALSRLYTRDAVLIPVRGRPSRGLQEVRQALSTRLPREADFRATFSDFTASGGLAYYSGEFTFVDTAEDGARYTASGTYVLVLQRTGSHWRIRAQIEHPDLDVLMAQMAAPAAALPAPDREAVAREAGPSDAAPPGAAGAGALP